MSEIFLFITEEITLRIIQYKAELGEILLSQIDTCVSAKQNFSLLTIRKAATTERVYSFLIPFSSMI